MTLQQPLSLVGLLGERIDFLKESLFGNLNGMIGEAASGARISESVDSGQNGFRVFELKSPDGTILGYFNLLFMKEGVPFYYLAFLEVDKLFRRNGLGNLALDYFAEFLEGKKACGILVNIIPEDHPTFTMYAKKEWFLFECSVGTKANYMVFIPSTLKGKVETTSLKKIVSRLEKKRDLIGIRQNELMVSRTLAEFQLVHVALLDYFEKQIKYRQSSELMRYFFTCFVFKLNSFMSSIHKLVGFTGGDSFEQIRLDPFVASLKFQPCLSEKGELPIFEGGIDILGAMADSFWLDPAGFIEALPNYGSPALVRIVKAGNGKPDCAPSLGDLFSMGFDPTRLKEACLGGVDYVIERKQSKHMAELKSRREILGNLEFCLEKKVIASWLKFNLPVCWIFSRGNTYIFRRKIPAIHYDEALDSLKYGSLKEMDDQLNFRSKISGIVRETDELLCRILGWDRLRIVDFFTIFISWHVKEDFPRFVVNAGGGSEISCYPEEVWVA